MSDHWDHGGSNSDVFLPDEDKKPTTPAKSMQGLEHILHSRAVRPPSQGGRPPSIGNSRSPRADRDWEPRDRDRRNSRPRENRPPSRDFEPPRYDSRSPRDSWPRDERPGDDRRPRDSRRPSRDNERPGDDRRPRDSRRPSRDNERPGDDRRPRDSRPPSRDNERPGDDRRPRDSRRPSRDNERPGDSRSPRERGHRDYDPYPSRDERPRDADRSRPPPSYDSRRSGDPYRPRIDNGPPPKHQGNRDLSLRVDKSTDALTPENSKDKAKELSKPERDEMAVDDGETGKRETWGHKAEFILATVGLAVGLGNVWRFPYLCQKNGGGAFLIPYVIFMLIEGLPLFFLELSIGQRMRKSAILCWRDIHPCLFGIGVGCFMVSLMLCLYYVVVIAWCCYYFFISFTSELPWKKETLCHNWPAYSSILDAIKACESGANPNCTTNSTMYLTLKNNESSFPDCCVRDPPQYYFYHHALQISTSIEDPGIGINVKLFGCLIFAWIITYLCVVKGIKSSGKVVYFTATFPYIILIILFFRGVTLEGAGEGLKTFFTPKWDLLLDANIWKDAATQMFFTLSLGFGALIAFASYMPLHNQVMRDAYTVVFINCGTSLFAGIVVFSILGYRQTKTGISADKVGSGPGLAFMTFSDAMLLMDVSPLWAILFFLMLILLGIDSEFGTLEAAIGPIVDLKFFPKVRKEFITLVLAVILFLFGISMVSGPGYYIFQIFDDYSVTIPLLVIALFQCIGVAWVYGNNRFADDIEFMTGKRPWIGWMMCWKYISPIALFVVLVALVAQQAQKAPTYSKYVGCVQKPFGDGPGSEDWTTKAEYPGWAVFLIVVIVLVSTIPILIWLIKDWPKNSARSFHKTFCTGLNNYAPDPQRDPNEQPSNPNV